MIGLRSSSTTSGRSSASRPSRSSRSARAGTSAAGAPRKPRTSRPALPSSTSSSASTSVRGATRKPRRDQLREDASGRECHERAEQGILGDACEELGAAFDHRLHDHRRPDPGGRCGDLGRVAEIESDSALLGLVGAGNSALDDHRVAELGRGRDCVLDRRGERLPDDRDPVRGEQFARLLGIEPDVVVCPRSPWL